MRMWSLPMEGRTQSQVFGLAGVRGEGNDEALGVTGLPAMANGQRCPHCRERVDVPRWALACP